MATNPIMNLLNVEWPEKNLSNWNVDYDLATTMDVGYNVPILTDKIMAHTHVRLNLGAATFTNPTIAPLYAKYKQQITAWWAPTALYVPKMRDGDKWDADTDVKYPFVCPDWTDITLSGADTYTGNGHEYIPTASLGHYLGLYPARFTTATWDTTGDVVPDRDGIPLLMYYDIFRNFIANQQEEMFPIRTRAFLPAFVNNAGQTTVARNAVDSYISRSLIDEAITNCRNINRRQLEQSVNSIFADLFGFDPLFARRSVFFLGDDVTNESQITDPANFIFAEDYNYGLTRSPYAADYFSSFVSNENVELERTKARVKVENDFFTMEQWKIASRMQNFIRKTIFSNSDFSEFIDVHFGVKPPRNLDKPMFLGARVEDIYFNDVISTAQTISQDSPDNTIDGNQNLGSRAAFGRAKLQASNDWFVEFTSREPGYLMLICTLIPEVSYFEGLDPMFSTLQFSEEYFPEFDAIGWQDKRKSTFNVVPRQDPTGAIVINGPLVKFDEWDTALAQEPAWFEYMAKYNRLSGQMTDPMYRHWTLARSFNHGYQAGDNVALNQLRAYNVYIQPEMFNGIFAVTQNVHNFQMYVAFDYKKRQPLSKQFLSF